ncbi:MAG: uroporphyrinogen decarboxylase [Lachnospiraceae bacterium]|nr:uroporphyrinogen decarboxylase [Lachnospiraceae bacterium]
MLSKKQNLLETIHGGHPDRYVNMFEAFRIVKDSPYFANNAAPVKGDPNVVNAWGVELAFPANTPGAFPVHKPADKIVIKDVTHWRDYLKVPQVKYPESAWEPYIKMVEEIDRNELFVTPMIYPGLFEQTHYLMEIQECLINFYEEPEAMHEIIDCLTEWEMAYVEELCKHYHPDAFFHHDDWGSQVSTFLSPEMFEEFYYPAYKQIYGYLKSHGVQVIVHHSDSYAATLVPMMIDMGIDIWQGVMNTNDIPALIEKYGGQITFMGGIDSASVDFPGWTAEDVARETAKTCKNCGTKYFIPCTSQGGPMSTFPGVYQAVAEEIDKQSKIYFK